MNVIEVENLRKVVLGVNKNCEEFVENNTIDTEIKRIRNDVDYSIIFQDYILKNVPFVLSLVLNDWKCLKEWVQNDKPNFDLLKLKFGSAVVPVANCGVRYFNAQEKENMTLDNFLDYWKKYIDNNYSDNMKCLYLKDWHFTKDFPNENVYIVPKYFASDWLNEYLTSKSDCNENGDDYRFVYMGPKGTWTPFHADVFSSYSWSANICGKKKWRLFPPGEEKKLKDKFGNLTYDVESESLRDNNLYPEYSDTIKYFDLLQEPGEAVFVPSGWHHQVWNLDDTISINHNWINGSNIYIMWLSLQQNLSLVKNEIADCKSMDGWNDHCQIMMKASYGINYPEFYEFLVFIAQRRINLINNCNNYELILYGGWKLGLRHAIFDLSKIRNIFVDIIQNEDIKFLSFFQVRNDEINVFVEKMNTILSQNML